MSTQKAGFWRGIAPALTLAVLAPVVAEVLPGATRFSSIFVLPIEICVWGCGAILIREAVRKWQLDWRGLICLALLLAVAEEFLIQQTSVAPMVIHLKGVVYARSLGINYVYLLWALIYETVFVVVIPVALAEMMFFERRKDPWLSKFGLFFTGAIFVVGARLAWFTWTRIARPKVFHLPTYQPPPGTTILALAAMAALVVLAVGRRQTAAHSTSSQGSQLHTPWILALSGFVWAVLLFGIVLLGFGIAPQFPPAVAVTAGLALGLSPLAVFSSRFGLETQTQKYWLASGAITGAMLVSFIGFIGASTRDLVFKILVDAIFLVVLLALKTKVTTTPDAPAGFSETV